jgi:hypothetical protein
VNHSLSLVALNCFPHLLSSNHKCAHPLLTAVQRRTSVRRNTGATTRNSKACRFPSHHACGSWRRSYSSLVIILCLDLRVHPSECNKEYCISLTLIRFITAMVLHSFVYHVCVNWSWRTYEMHSVFLVKSGVTAKGLSEVAPTRAAISMRRSWGRPSSSDDGWCRVLLPGMLSISGREWRWRGVGSCCFFVGRDEGAGDLIVLEGEDTRDLFPNRV